MSRVRVADGVRDRLRRDPIGRHLDRRRQRRERRALIDADVRSGQACSVDADPLLADRAHQTELVERHRPQSVDELPHLADRVAGRPAKLVEQRSCPGGIPGQEVGGRVGPEGDRGQGRSQSIVQIVPEAAALIFERGHEALPRPL